MAVSTCTSRFTPQKFIIVLMIMTQCYSAERNLIAPNLVKVPTGKKTHFTCVYSGDDAHTIHISWDHAPTEFVSYTEIYNITGRYLTSNVKAEHTSTESEKFKCTARDTHGNTIDEATTRLHSCPTDKLECNLQVSKENTCMFQLTCRYIPQCHTTLRCVVNGTQLSFPGMEPVDDDDSFVSKYCEVSLREGDIVKCSLYTPDMLEHLQTQVVLTVESTMTSVPTPETEVTPATTTDTLQTKPADEDPQTSCNYLECWLPMLALIPIEAGVVVVVQKLYKWYKSKKYSI